MGVPFFNGRDYRIRTYDILLPKQALYQAELSPVRHNRGNVTNINYFASIFFDFLEIEVKVSKAVAIRYNLCYPENNLKL